MRIYEDIKKIKGIGEKTASLFNKLAVFTIEDLLHFYPRTYLKYEDASKIMSEDIGYTVSLDLMVVKSFTFKKLRNINIGQGLCSDGDTNISLIFFNAPYLKDKLQRGSRYIFHGKLQYENNQYKMEHPDIFTFAEYEALKESLQPVYPLTKGLSNKIVLKSIGNAIEEGDYPSLYDEYLPQAIVDSYRLMSIKDAIKGIHFPKDTDFLVEAKRRLAFDELFLFMIKLRSLRENIDELSTFSLIETAGPKRLIERLPYKLTSDQEHVFEEVVADLCSGKVMKRLIQGDVGSGKTIIAFLSMLMCVENGYQAALMAPTEILATQHFDKLSSMIKSYDLKMNCVLLTGSLNKSKKNEIYDDVKNGKYNVIIGTHAIIQDGIEFNNLALVITDEQHRFGVNQRQTFKDKGKSPHVLVMSATPIPRTLAMVLYQDIHLSTIMQKPANRLPVKNCVVDTSYRKTAYKFFLSQINEGRQAYIICPMVEESEGLENVENVIDYCKKLKNEFPASVTIEYLHGKMKPKDKKEIMDAFYNKDIDILVSTSVIEVGIDVPNANIIMIENAERFGLSALHQLRGRIGRGSCQSYAIFVNGNNKKKKNERLNILNSTNDGFEVAKEDLKLRGAGDIFGIRQSGEFDFEIADIFDDADMIIDISKTLDELYKEDPLLSKEDNTKLREYLLQKKDNYIDFGTI